MAGDHRHAHAGEISTQLRRGWVAVGDLARQDDEGYLTIVDRKKNVINSGGLKVLPRELEAVLATHPAVREAAAFGTPDPHWGEAVTAAVVRQPGTEVSAETLREHGARSLARYKLPKSVTFVDALPRTEGDKVDYDRLRASARTTDKPDAV